MSASSGGCTGVHYTGDLVVVVVEASVAAAAALLVLLLPFTTLETITVTLLTKSFASYSAGSVCFRDCGALYHLISCL